jgi:ATP-binding cassette subfamily B protein
LRSGYHIIAGLRKRVCDHLRYLSLAFFRKNEVSKISSKLINDMGDAEKAYCSYLYEMAACFVAPTLLGLSMLFVDWRLTLTLCGMICLALPFLGMALKSAQMESPHYLSMRAEVEGTLLEYINGIGELKGAGRTGTAFTPFMVVNDAFIGLTLRLETRLGIRAQLFIGMLDLAFVAVLITGTLLLVSASTDMAVFLFFLLLSHRFIDPLQNLGMFLTQFRFTTAAMNRVSQILEEQPLPVRDGFILPQDNSVVFKNVSFSYGDREVLSDISFHMPEGSVTALVGESGGGKTTLANLLLRFWDVCSGSICIGGVDIRSFSQEDLYSRFSVVFQEAYLFNDTVMDNIRMARPQATDEEVMEASRLSNCHEFILGLTGGYDALVGEGGSRLSGGERQRIAIARALLKNAPLLILDEATSSVDPENELQIQQGLTNLMRDKTLLVIAHRLITIREADQILVLKQGKIVESGTHEALTTKNGLYKRLWDQQEITKQWRYGAE